MLMKPDGVIEIDQGFIQVIRDNGAAIFNSNEAPFPLQPL